MRILVVAENAETGHTRAAELRRAGFEIVGTSSRLDSTATLRRLRCDTAVVIDDGPTPLDTKAIHHLVTRLRSTSESRLPIVLLLEDGSVWLRARLSDRLGPTLTLPKDTSARTVGEALEGLGHGAEHPGTSERPVARLDPVRREVTASGGAATLTPSELTIAWELAMAEGEIVTFETLSRALWEAPADRSTRAALRTHVHTLRLKLGGVAPGLEIENRAGVGYRLTRPLLMRGSRG